MRDGVRGGVRLSVSVSVSVSLGDVREEGGGQPPLGVQLDDDPPRGDALVRVRAHGAARLGAREQRPQGRAARKRVLRGGGVRRWRRAACCACVCGRAEGGRRVACESWCMISCQRGFTTVSE